MYLLTYAVAFILLAPLLAGILAGIDRKITARMQGRFGPPILQPFFDVGKLFEKELAIVNRTQMVWAACYLGFIIFGGALFFAGGDLLLVIFAFTLAHVFLVLGAYSSNSPYSHIGAERELILLMAYEPVIILAAAGMYLVTKSFAVSGIAGWKGLLITALPAVFVAVVIIVVMKMRKSPFDISTSHHAHQEIVKGVTTEFSGPNLGLIEIAHWYESIFLLGFVYLFFAAWPWLGVLAVVLTYSIIVLVDNTFARLRWTAALSSGWALAGMLCLLNLFALYFLGV